ncbi:hypothetical protein NE237_017875 [Protea cynaroides]|uniref:Uncharacterized protein n=1 Tax=Protea cynaroides TaxID=273540 RepID=A0A9Q0K8U4_9MAGN|nr:hypothetical protein NE237_017875 [Protea cynaroides]
MENFPHKIAIAVFVTALMLGTALNVSTFSHELRPTEDSTLATMLDLQTRRILASGSRHGGLYSFDGSHIEDQIQVHFFYGFCSTAEDVWHHSLGYPQRKITRYLRSNGSISPTLVFILQFLLLHLLLYWTIIFSSSIIFHGIASGFSFGITALSSSVPASSSTVLPLVSPSSLSPLSSSSLPTGFLDLPVTSVSLLLNLSPLHHPVLTRGRARIVNLTQGMLLRPLLLSLFPLLWLCALLPLLIIRLSPMLRCTVL